MITFLTLFLACGDKDPSTDPVDDTAQDTGDTGALALDCTLGALSPRTLPVEADATAAAVLTCNQDATVQAVTLDGEDVAFEHSGDTLTVTARGKRPGAFFLSVQVAGKDPASDLRLDAPLRFHGPPTFEAPQGVAQLEVSGELLWSDETVLVRVDDELVELDQDGTELRRGPTNGVCSFGACFCVSYDAGQVCHDGGSTVLVDSLEDVGPDLTEVEGEVLHAVWGGTAPLVVFRKIEEATPDSSGGVGGTVAYDVATGRTYDLGRTTGEARILGDTVVVSECSKEGTRQLTELPFKGGKALSATATEVSCDTAWRASVADLDDDGIDDELHFFDHEGGTELVARMRDGGGTLTVETGSVQAGATARGGRVVTVADYGIFVEVMPGVEGPVPQPLYRGPGERVIQPAHSVTPPSDAACWAWGDDHTWLNCPGVDWQMAVGTDGTTLNRTRSADGAVAFELDGEPVTGLPDALHYGVYQGHTVTVSADALTLDEREMPGCYWSLCFDLTPVGTGEEGVIWLQVLSEEGLGLVAVDLDDPDGTDARVRKKPDLLTAEWDVLLDDPLVALSEGDGSGAAPGEVVAEVGALVAPTLVAVLPQDDGCALMVLPGTSTQVPDLLAGAVVLDQAETCEALPAPMGSVDLWGDGSWSALLSDGSVISISGGSIVLHDDAMVSFDRLVAGGDFNGDGLGDVIVERDGQLDLWLGAGDGTALDPGDATVPGWVQSATLPSAGPGLTRPVSAIFPTSWASMLD